VSEPREEKVAVVDEVRGKLSSASAAILTEYRGLKMAELQALRRSLRAAGGEYKIYKNTLVRFATRELGIEVDALLEGPTAIAFADADVPGVAKALRDFSRTNPLLVVKGGVMGTSVLTPADANALADIPPREVLLARLAGLMAAPMQQFAGLLQALPRNFAYGLQALIDAKGGVPAEVDATPEVDAVAEAESAPAADAVAAPEPAPAPPVDAVAEPAPEVESVPVADAAPEVESVPAVDAPPAVEPAPEADAAAEREAAPEIETVAEADSATEVQATDEAESAPEVEAVIEGHSPEQEPATEEGAD
jgi:large subunit ribosomal protein L10